MKRLIASLSLMAFAAALAGCNTVAGVGQDLQKAGDKIEEAAKKK
jgi:predicted small secreted protein